MDNNTNPWDDSSGSRDDKIFSLFKNGSTLQQIGDGFRLTRERVRQVILRIIKKDLLHKLIRKEIILDPPLKVSAYEFINSKDGRSLIKSEFELIYKYREKQKISKKIISQEELGVIPEKFTSRFKYAKSLGTNLKKLEKFYPEKINKLRENLTIGQGGKKWSRYYLRCRMCGTTIIKHRSHGYCVKCYPKTEQFKELQRESRFRYLEARKPKLLTYQKRYHDKKYFGGNRLKALEKDNYRCKKCGIDNNSSLSKYGQGLRIVHIDNIKDNSLENLITLCRYCMMKYVRFKRDNSGKQNLLRFFHK